MRIKIDRLKEGVNSEIFTREELKQALSGEKKIVRTDGLVLNIEKNRSFLHATGSFSVTYTDVCDRCAEDYDAELIVNIDYYFHIGKIEGKDSEDIEIINPDENDGDLIFDGCARESFILAQPVRSLCSSDCKGLCPKCGANLNAGPCSCPKDETADPRWEVLTKMLKKK